MSRRMWVLASLAWVGVVIAGSAVTWVAIDRAGEQVTAGPGSAPTEPATGGSAPTAASTSSSRPSPKPSSTATAGHTATTTPSSVPPSSSSPSTPRTSGPPAVHTVRRTWSGTAGTFTASCTGRTVRFEGASPNDGWSVERGDDGGGEVEVRFRNGEAEVQVQATCVGGVPQFHVETGGDSSDGAAEQDSH